MCVVFYFIQGYHSSTSAMELDHTPDVYGASKSIVILLAAAVTMPVYGFPCGLPAWPWVGACTLTLVIVVTAASMQFLWYYCGMVPIISSNDEGTKVTLNIIRQCTAHRYSTSEVLLS